MNSNMYVPNNYPSCRVDIRKKVEEFGYKVEEHKITTSDGYIVSLIRILPKLTFDVDKNPILFVHGLGADANMWMLTKLEFSLPVLLSSLGYDVWLGNIRGTYYSNEHINPDISSQEYWNFSLDEIAKCDIVDFINRVINVTQRKKLIYIGYSLGTTLLFAAVSINPNLEQFIEKFVGIAPVAYIQNLKGLLSIFSYLLSEEKVAKTVLGNEYFNPYNNPVASFLKSAAENVYMPFIPFSLNYVFGYSQFAFLKLADVLMKMNSTTSARMMLHYLQIIKSGEFRHYDYGTELNLIKYNSATPTAYSLNCFNIPSYLFSGDTDFISSEEDVQIIKNELPNVKHHKIFQNFSHMDFISCKSGTTSINQSIISIL